MAILKRLPLVLALVPLASCANPVDAPSRQKEQAFVSSDGNFETFLSTSLVDEWTLTGTPIDVDKPRVILGGPWVVEAPRSPITVRARNITRDETSGWYMFEVAPRRWRYDDDTSQLSAVIPVLAVGDGVHEIADPHTGNATGYHIEAGRARNVTHLKKHISFSSSFRASEKPIVLAAQVSHNGKDPTVVRITKVDTEGFDLYLDEEGGTSHGKEELVDWIAFERGLGMFPESQSGKCAFVMARSFETDETFFGTWVKDPFDNAHFYALQTDNGSEAAQAQYAWDDSQGDDMHFIRVAEEGSDGETNHVDEEIGSVIFSWSDCL